MDRLIVKTVLGKSWSSFKGTVLMYAGRDILIVEDNAVIAADLKILFEDREASVRVAHDVRSALLELWGYPFDAVLPDILLGAETSTPVADFMLDNEIPFIFTTGYSDFRRMPERFRHVVRALKPYRENDLILKIDKALAGDHWLGPSARGAQRFC